MQSFPEICESTKYLIMHNDLNISKKQIENRIYSIRSMQEMINYNGLFQRVEEIPKQPCYEQFKMLPFCHHLKHDEAGTEKHLL